MNWVVKSSPVRLDRFLSDQTGKGRRVVSRWIQDGFVLVDGRPRPAGFRLTKGNLVSISLEDDAMDDWAPAPQDDLDLPILAIDDQVIVLDKPSAMPAHPVRYGQRNTVANFLAGRFPECIEASAQGGGKAREAGLCHRLDNGTSGVLVAARTAAVYGALRNAFATGHVHKEYIALVEGHLDTSGTIDSPLVQDSAQPRTMRVIEALDDERSLGRSRILTAHTEYTVLSSSKTRSLLLVHPTTGRPHQIRVHLASIGLPIVGDRLYGQRRRSGTSPSPNDDPFPSLDIIDPSHASLPQSARPDDLERFFLRAVTVKADVPATSAGNVGLLVDVHLDVPVPWKKRIDDEM